MKRNLACLVGILVVFVVVESGAAESLACDPSTCPPGPVTVQFQYPNCSGERVYTSLPFTFTECSYGASLQEVDGALVITNFGFANLNCDSSLANATYDFYVYKYGKCAPTLDRKREGMGLGTMYLSNVNDSFVSPQDFLYDPSIVMSEPGSADCFGPDNCTLNNGSAAQYWTTQDTSDECDDPTSSSFNPNMQMNTCLNGFNGTYIKFGCFEEHGYYAAYFADSECTEVTRIVGQRSVCSSASMLTIHCTAPLTPIPDYSDPPIAEPVTQAPEAPVAPSLSPTTSPTAQSPPVSGSDHILSVSSYILWFNFLTIVALSPFFA